MTNWLPDLSTGTGPLYVRLANQIEAAIDDGQLPPGTKLPPQRNIAFDLGLTVGTISRAYALVHERGLVSGEVGRGTYVLDRSQREPGRETDPVSIALAGTRIQNAEPDKLRFDSASAPDVGQAAVIAEITNAVIRSHPWEIASYTRNFPASWSEAGARWLGRAGFRPQTDCIVPTIGAHAAVVAILSVVTVPGDRVAFEPLTYSQISRAAGLTGRRCVMVESDEDGLIPEEFERVCAQQHPKLLFLMPNVQNPTLTMLPESRRREIAEIARRHGVWIIEDDLYGSLVADPPPPMSAFAPERTFLVSGLSKSVAAGVRGGWVSCPPLYAPRVRIAHKMMTGGLPFLLAEVTARLVLSGEAGRLMGLTITELTARERMARLAFAGIDFQSRPGVPFLWMKLPEPWLSGTFKKAAQEDNILIDDEDEFKSGRCGSAHPHVRISFSTPTSRDVVQRGFAKLACLLETGRTGYDRLAG
nr:PLP-dependent aminotransferase family protein [uncultured Gellertiella sp.]